MIEKRLPPGLTTGFVGVTNEMVAAFSTTISFFAGSSESSAIETFLVLLLPDLPLRTDDKIEGFRGNLELGKGCVGLLGTAVAWARGTETDAVVVSIS